MNMKKLSLILMVLIFAMGSVLAQRTVTGTVTDDTGDALIGANVLVKGTSVGAVTDLDGNYTVEVPEGSNTLVVSYTGYETQEIELGASNVLDVTMSEGVLLTEAVVTALGISREKKALGYSVQDVKGEELNVARDANAINALSGKVAGLQIIASSGNVGASNRVIIRGNSSISGSNQPLYVINGVPMDNGSYSGNKFQPASRENQRYGGVDYGNAMQDLNPDDIESISVLKGPNAAALYGSRAANGVILITTKNGKGMKKGIGVSYSGNIGFSTPFRLPTYQDKYGQGYGYQFNYVDGTNTAPGSLNDGVDESWGPAFDASISQNDGIDNDGDGDIDESGEGATINQYHGQNQPWVAKPNSVEDMFDTGILLTNSVALSANADNVYGRFSFTNMDQKGLVPNTDLRRNVFNLGFGMNFTEDFRADGNIAYTRTDSDNRPGVGYDGDNVLQQTIWVGRQVDWQDLKDNYDTTDEFGRPYNWNHNYQNNPFLTLFENVKPMDRDRVNGFFRMTWDINDWLSVAGRVGNDFYRENRKRIFAVGSIDFPNGTFETDNFTVNERNMDLLITARKPVSDNLTIGVSVGGNRMKRDFSQESIQVNALTVPGIYNVSNADGNPIPYQFESEKAINSVYGMVNLEFNNFLYLDLTGRNDWSSTLPTDNNSYFYPSVSLGVVLSEPLNMGAFTDFFKIRGGWAQVGSDTDPYKLRPTFTANDPWSATPSFAVPNELPATELQPETQVSFEAGLEWKMFRNRVGIDFAYYNSETRDQIIPVDASPTTGFTNRVINAGTIANNGIEVFVTGTPVRTSDFAWDIELNWATNNSEVKDLPDGVDAILLGDYWGLRLEAREGEPYGTFRGLKALYSDGQLVLDGGIPQVDPQPDPDDPTGLAILGNINPDWIGGVRNTITFKDLSFSFLFDMKQGGDVFSMSYMFGRYAGVFEESLEGRETLDQVINGHVYPGLDGTAEIDANGNRIINIEGPNETAVQAQSWNHAFWRGYAGHDRSVFDASFIKLREVSLSYSFPTEWFGDVVQGLSLGVYGRNLALLHSNVPHIDPESAFGNGNDVQGFEFGQLPSARTIGVKLNASF